MVYVAQAMSMTTNEALVAWPAFGTACNKRTRLFLVFANDCDCYE